VTDHQPAVIWCPNCGDSLSVPVKVFAVNVHGEGTMKVQLETQYVRHRCGEPKS
jgi:hypothetical protein